MPVDEYQVWMYMSQVRRTGAVNGEIRRIQERMVDNVKHPASDAETQRDIVSQLNQLFKLLLAEKAAQEALEKVGNDDRGNTQDSSTRVAHDPRPRVRIWNILK